MTKALVIPVDPLEIRVEDLDAEQPGLLHRIIGGWLEAVAVPDHDAHMYVNEEGRLEGLPINEVASVLARKHIVGTAIVFGSHNKPEEGDVPQAIIDLVAPLPWT